MDNKNLGWVRAVQGGTTPPNNIKMLWFDENLGVNKMKFYNNSTDSWQPLYTVYIPEGGNEGDIPVNDGNGSVVWQPQTVSTGTWFIHPDGTDEVGYGTILKPFQTIEYAISVASVGDSFNFLPSPNHVINNSIEFEGTFNFTDCTVQYSGNGYLFDSTVKFKISGNGVFNLGNNAKFIKYNNSGYANRVHINCSEINSYNTPIELGLQSFCVFIGVKFSNLGFSSYKIVKDGNFNSGGINLKDCSLYGITYEILSGDPVLTIAQLENVFFYGNFYNNYYVKLLNFQTSEIHYPIVMKNVSFDMGTLNTNSKAIMLDSNSRLNINGATFNRDRDGDSYTTNRSSINSTGNVTVPMFNVLDLTDLGFTGAGTITNPISGGYNYQSNDSLPLFQFMTTVIN